jgi:transcription termination factor Rho
MVHKPAVGPAVQQVRLRVFDLTIIQEDCMKKKMVSAMTAAAVLVVLSPAFAQETAPAPAPEAPASAPASAPSAEAPKAPEPKESKDAEKGKGKGKGKEKGKKHGHGKGEGKKHGLDRADEAAGEHGKQGRDNARSKQGE